LPTTRPVRWPPSRNPIPVNATTTVYITRPIVLEVDSSGYEGDFEQRIRPRAVCRLFF